MDRLGSNRAPTSTSAARRRVTLRDVREALKAERAMRSRRYELAETPSAVAFVADLESAVKATWATGLDETRQPNRGRADCCSARFRAGPLSRAGQRIFDSAIPLSVTRPYVTTMSSLQGHFHRSCEAIRVEPSRSTPTGDLTDKLV
jgi:hypothetical protein